MLQQLAAAQIDIAADGGADATAMTPEYIKDLAYEAYEEWSE